MFLDTYTNKTNNDSGSVRKRSSQDYPKPAIFIRDLINIDEANNVNAINVAR
jgi:hypothetical protein